MPHNLMRSRRFTRSWNRNPCEYPSSLWKVISFSLTSTEGGVFHPSIHNGFLVILCLKSGDFELLCRITPRLEDKVRCTTTKVEKEACSLSSLPYHSYCPRIEMDPWRTHSTGVWLLWQKTWKPHYLCSAIAQHLVLLCITSCTHVIYLSNVSMHSPILCFYLFWQ